MTGLELLVVGGSLLLLFLGGWWFLAYSHQEMEERETLVRVLFATVFALSGNMLQLLLFEILGVLEPG